MKRKEDQLEKFRDIYIAPAARARRRLQYRIDQAIAKKKEENATIALQADRIKELENQVHELQERLGS